MKNNIVILLVFLVSNYSGQQGYWQQQVDYKMEIDFNAKKNQFKGIQTLTYTNNSPDTLHKIFYHLYYNAFQPGSMMDVRSRNIPDPDPRVDDRISKLKKNEIGYHDIISLTEQEDSLQYNVEGTIMEVHLTRPLIPGMEMTFIMKFKSQVPVQIRRTGRHNMENVDFSMTQWYPKLCEYDLDGWHTNPYIGREFHGVWGNFDIKINIDSSYVLGGTGVIINPLEVGCGYENVGDQLIKNENETKTWHFIAENVHDFAWAADPDYIHDISVLDNGTIIHFLHIDDSLNDNWVALKDYAVRCFEYMNENFGTYPYPQYSVIQGGDGGMEYPMCTLITSGGSFGGLVSVTVHESIHSWFQGLLATNESKYEWMDEGFCTYAQYKTMNYLYDKNVINPLSRQYGGYYRLANTTYQEPLTTHADFYKLNYVYGTNAYSKGAVFLSQLGYIIGDKSLMEGMRKYYYQWRYKHPTPRDFKRVMEKISGLELDWYFEQFVETINTIDYGINEVNKKGKKTEIVLSRNKEIPMPVDVFVILKDGTVQWYNIPLRIMRGEKREDLYPIEMKVLADWPWVEPEYSFNIDVPLKMIKEIQIDPSGRLADIDQTDNVYPKPTNE